MKRIYWVGPRQSDIDNIGFQFVGSVTIYGNNQNGNIAYCKNNQTRINHNIDNVDCDLFFKNTLSNICHSDPEAYFLFYKFSYAYYFDEYIQKRTLGLNSFELIDTLSDKLRCRVLLRNVVDTIPFVTLKGQECSFNNISKYFPSNMEFIVQKLYSSGGEGTYIITSNSNVKFDYTSEYLVSPYIKDSISLNVHIGIVNNKVIYFPPSIQIVIPNNNQLLYQGADFICYESLSDKIKNSIKEKSIKIGNILCKKGYKGILGIDFLLSFNSLYFMEINPRFQASSHLLNKALYSECGTSLQEIHLQSFDILPTTPIKEFKVEYSNFAYCQHNISKIRLQKIVTSKEILQLQLDGFNIYSELPTEGNTYFFRCVFTRNICTINNGKMLLHANIYTEDIKKVLNPENKHYKENIKIALLNHGVTLTQTAKKIAKTKGVIREAVFDAIDITVFNGLPINVPTTCKFVSLSPFTITCINNKLTLLFEEQEISEIEISYVPNTLLNKFTRSGIPYDAVINLANDRIRINPAPVCIYKQKQIPCKFCNLPTENIEYELNDIIEIIDYCINNVEFRHFLIGGGTYSLDGGWNIIIQIAQYIRSNCDKDIYLMSIPPTDAKTLDEIKESGITEVAFNLEIFDRYLAEKLMPGKGKIKLEQYISSFAKATSLWGHNGNVRSLLIYGFDTDAIFLSGIEELCRLGVEPIISIFRPLENTELENMNPPATLDIINIYQQCQLIVQKYSMVLGPDCPQCQNNTLSYTEFN